MTGAAVRVRAGTVRTPDPRTEALCRRVAVSAHAAFAVFVAQSVVTAVPPESDMPVVKVSEQKVAASPFAPTIVCVDRYGIDHVLLTPLGLPELGVTAVKAKIDTEQGKRIYARRLGIVEPVFANICVHKRMHRFTVRTKIKVDVQWRLFALVHNIGKIHTFGAIH